MTRGHRGCFIWSPDPETREYFKAAIGCEQSAARTDVVKVIKPKPLPFDPLPEHEREKFVNCIPVFTDLNIAAGGWGEECSGSPEFLELADLWIPLPKGVRSKQMAFVARISGKSMEPLVPDGAWCVFGPPHIGDKSGKHLLVWYSTTSGSGQYTLKTYKSEKSVYSDESQKAFEHKIILLKSINKEFEPIFINPEQGDELRIVAEFLQVLPEKKAKESNS